MAAVNGIDWGYAAPWAVLWAAIDEDGWAWFYRKLYARNVGEADQAQRILAAEGDGGACRELADDAVWAKRGEMKPISDVYAENGCHLTGRARVPARRCRAGNAGTPTSPKGQRARITARWAGRPAR